MAKKVKEIKKNHIICDGIVLSKNIYERKENRLFTLLLKGFIVYLLCMGSIGFFMSAIGAEYNELLCHVVIFVGAIFCALLYYRLLTENIGYFILIIVFGGAVFVFRNYINSGYYAIINIVTDIASQYFDVGIQRVYTEQITNRGLTITVFCLFLGIVMDILLNVYVSRRMQYVVTAFLTLLFNLIPLYLTEEPNMFYSGMLLLGLTLTYVFKAGKHYSPQVVIKRDNSVYKQSGPKKNPGKVTSYVYNVKVMLQAGLVTVFFTLICLTVVSALKPVENFNTGYTTNKYKRLSLAAASTVLTDGFAELFSNSPDDGGLSGGRLGNVSTVRLDYETDLEIYFTPYSYDMLYLKQFTGQQYNSYSNRWSSIYDNEELQQNIDNYKEQTGSGYVFENAEACSLQQEFFDDGEYSARGEMVVNPIGISSSITMPYYTFSYTSGYSYSDAGGIHGFIYNYFPRFDANEANVRLSDYIGDTAVYEQDYYVPDENIDTISDFVEKYGISGNKDEIISEVMEVFQNDYPYTVSPGKTPSREDFVNFFLEENKKGYCSHYASAATLIFRYLGIPARYVEGYAVSYDQITMNGEIVEQAEYSDYYEGYSELGKTAVVKVNATDADAHAWVEVYDDKKGWVVVDVTPSSDGVDEQEDFWAMFADMMDSSSSEVSNTIGGNVNYSSIKKVVRIIGYAIVVLIFGPIILFVFYVLIKRIWRRILYLRGDINDRLVYNYSDKCKRIRKKDKNFRQLNNYEEQIKYLMLDELAMDRDRMILIMDSAGFSNKLISKDDYEYAEGIINKLSPRRNNEKV